MTNKKSKALFKRARRLIPGGVNSPVRAFKSVGGEPLFIKRASGSKIYDADGNEYIDYVGSWGPMILGHSHPQVVSALKKAIDNGTSYGAPTELEIRLAEMVIKAFPSIEMIRMVNSGTEATMSAIRLARAYTKRDRIIKFEGCYHGHADSLLVKAGSGAVTLGLPDSPGVPADFAKNTITLPFNNIGIVEDFLNREGETIACIILEPIIGNIGVVPPQNGFLQGLREVTKKYGIVLIFDEVMTGFRIAYGGAQELYNISGDLTCLGKIIGGGLPVGAYGGKREIMEMVAPAGPVYQAGTLSGNPLAMTAGIETLKILSKTGVYKKLEKISDKLCKGMEKGAREAGIPVYSARVGSMFSMFFTDREVIDYATAKTSDTVRFSKYFSMMLKGGIYLAPSQFEAGFVSLAHSDNDIDKTIEISCLSIKNI
ncbi:MAG: glutamate-1-semialdehyde-2,1-aminomutase [Nitrospinae bacterium RIFCSPLOWO2_02_FULL_39_110]|nr:MAG: glutamate-1-semialdehyde-2,1-aminomutase [Nitrospinae bacterium RIFCSPHIGHO2_02_39_11]OGV99914.1 MAG: glutamate-1-semialdehyde-2,1-aminomutase [Nitrospinae bacterium RIFCSPHIGHO2_12_FULL_39_42]OGW02108.1 MAG: glutamate-1-semialdehyde-2,1-aminomutase [Nitrospinae bacterium RIFCSPHIGHO2_02_FULL_39_82]OGW02298.1 MAG: glutamate-1-semialdehyde-2,1-aminomutase [Nitrospinae bacterium RIFCSPLOWO2_02_39_17]OGW04655.1 MAG: glutamate-1-semialdehyde-2,1-aminomutase [Nitrospinae bacterium RIFCSPLOWO